VAMFESFTAGTSGTAVIGDTVYVSYRFIPVPIKVDMLAGTVTVVENCTHGIPVKYPICNPAQVCGYRLCWSGSDVSYACQGFFKALTYINYLLLIHLDAQ
jgi:hypothetical protein